jgi:hypothetical protein
MAAKISTEKYSPSILRRIQLFIHGFEYMVEAVFGNWIVTENVRRDQNGYHWDLRVKKWNPAFWIAALRILVFKDQCGSAHFKK